MCSSDLAAGNELPAWALNMLRPSAGNQVRSRAGNRPRSPVPGRRWPGRRAGDGTGGTLPTLTVPSEGSDDQG